MIKYSWNRHHKGYNKFYTESYKKEGVKGVHSFERQDIFEDFIQMVMEDVIVHMKKVRLPVGVLHMHARKMSCINWQETVPGDVVIQTSPETDDMAPRINLRKNKTWKRHRNWRIYVREPAVQMMRKWFIKNGYKNYIR